MTDPSPIILHSEMLYITILPRGAALVGVRFAGEDRNHVIGFADPDDHQRVPMCAGMLVGPVANRVRNGRLVVDGQPYQMPINENTNCLHSGPEGLHTLLWQVTAQSSDGVTLETTLEDGANGLPGRRQIKAVYHVTQNTLSLSLSATTDRATPMNIASHPYWNLDGHADISSHQLSVEAAHYLPTDAQGLPTGEERDVAQTPFDFTKVAPVPLSPDLDVNFCLAAASTEPPRHAATLTGRDGTRLEIATTAPGLQVYAGANIPSLDVKMADCPPLEPYVGIALEPQHWPDAPHHKHFPRITLRPGETYRQTTLFTLTRG